MAEPGNPLGGMAWKLGELGDQGAVQGAEPTLEFTQPGNVAGTGSCNRFTATVTLSGEAISFGPLAATRMSCSEQINAQQTKYFKGLEGAHRYVIQGNSLMLYTKAMDEPLVFIRTKI